MLKSFNYGIRLHQKIFEPRMDHKRAFWEYVNMMFNKPDSERIQKLGPNRTCAEWVLRNGGRVVWANGTKLADYNSLPSEDQAVPNLLEIDGTDSGISHYGFSHLIGCKMIRKVVLHNNCYIDDRALRGLSHAKESLTHVQVSRCPNVTDAGLKAMKELGKLETLVLFDLSGVRNFKECKEFIQSHLSSCKIQGEAKEVNEKSQ